MHLGTGSAPAAAAEALEEIVVTATRREQTVQEIPFNISAIRGEALEKANIIDSVEALRTVAGISIADRGYRNNTGGANGIIIRGINVDTGANGDVPLAAPPTVATYVDNTALYGNFILKDIDRIEVLRGPQGTLYGSGSLAGNVRYIMNKPDPSAFGGKLSLNGGVTEGSDGYNLNPDVMLNIPVSEDFALRLNAGMIDNDGVIDYPNVYVLDGNGDPLLATGDVVNDTPVYRKVEDADDVDIKYARASALYRPSDRFMGQLSFQWQEDDIGGRRQATKGINAVSGEEYDDYEFGAVQLEPSEREVKMSALELEFGLGFATLTSSTSYYEHTGSGVGDNSGLYARYGWFGFYGYSPRPIARAERFYDDSAWSQELRLVSEGENFIDWTVGLYYMDQDYDLGQDSFLVGYIPYLNAIDWYGLAPYQTNQDFLFRRNQQYTEQAAFGEATINFTDTIHLTLGGRWFDNEVDVDAVVDVPIYSSPSAPPGFASENISESDFLGKANLAWDLSDDSMLYLTFSQGYRHAGANAVPTSGKYGESPDFFTFDSDTLDNYEIGYKGTMGELSYAASLYYTEWEDPQLNTATPNWGFFAVVNGESAETQGLELELNGSLGDHFSYSLGYTYADSTLTDDVYAPAGNFYGSSLTVDRIGAEDHSLPGTADHVFNVSLSWVFTLAEGMDLNTVLSGYYQSDIVNSLGDDNCRIGYNANQRCRDNPRPESASYAPMSIFSPVYAELDSFQLWNLSSTLSKDEWAVSLYVKNLFDEDGATGAYPVAYMGPNPNMNYYGNNSREYLAQPRTYGAVVSYSF
jgi:outer membrane receptor protein involved in Fe transport